VAQSIGADHEPMVMFELIEQFRVRSRVWFFESGSDQLGIHSLFLISAATGDDFARIVAQPCAFRSR
jgi:hypothetical protein